MTEELVEIIVDGLPVPVSKEEAADPNIEDIVRENRRKVAFLTGNDTEADELLKD